MNQEHIIGTKQNQSYELIHIPIGDTQGLIKIQDTSVTEPTKLRNLRKDIPITMEELQHLHIVLGHLNYQYLTIMIQKGLIITGISKVDNWFYNRTKIDTTTEVSQIDLHGGTK